MRPKRSTPTLDTVIYRGISDNDLINAQNFFRGIMKIFKCSSFRKGFGEIEVKTFEQFKELVLDIEKDRDWQKRYGFIYAKDDKWLIVRPIRSTRRLITVILPGVEENELKEMTEKEKFLANVEIPRCLHYFSEDIELPKGK